MMHDYFYSEFSYGELNFIYDRLLHAINDFIA